MKVGVANATKKDFDLHIALGGIASRDCCRGQRRLFTGGGVGFRFVSSGLHGETCCPRFNIASECHAALDTIRAVFAATRDILLEECPFERRI
jgi:hypothetical protein